MLWPFMLPRRLDITDCDIKPSPAESMDKLLASDAWKETERQAAEAGKFWARARKDGDAKIREAIIREGRIKYLHQGGKP